MTLLNSRNAVVFVLYYSTLFFRSIVLNVLFCFVLFIFFIFVYLFICLLIFQTTTIPILCHHNFQVKWIIIEKTMRCSSCVTYSHTHNKTKHNTNMKNIVETLLFFVTFSSIIIYEHPVYRICEGKKVRLAK